MATYANVSVTTKFNDGTNRKVTIGPVGTNALTNVKTRIRNLNDSEYRTEHYPNFDDGYLSDNGAPFIGITAASIQTINRTYFNIPE